MQHRFVEHIPDEMEPNKLYISIEHNIAVHKCACGCEVDVVTPLSPGEWAVTYDGETASLWPSIGNWGFPCQSHYVIKRGQIQWARKFDREKIERVRQNDLEAKELQYGGSRMQIQKKATAKESEIELAPSTKPASGVWRKLLNWLGF